MRRKCREISMAKRYNFLTRCLAAVALLFLYVVSSSAILVGATTTPAQAWRGGGRGWGGRGFYGGRGYYGRGYYYAPRAYYYAPGPRCYFSYRWGRTICRW
jgi:uncharacterized membrane protein